MIGLQQRRWFDDVGSIATACQRSTDATRAIADSVEDTIKTFRDIGVANVAMMRSIRPLSDSIRLFSDPLVSIRPFSEPKVSIRPLSDPPVSREALYRLIASS
jgi:hypothetical protein